MQIRADCFAVSVGNERAAVIGNERKVCAILRSPADGHGVNPILDTRPQFWGYPLRRATKPATKPSTKFEVWLCDVIYRRRDFERLQSPVSASPFFTHATGNTESFRIAVARRRNVSHHDTNKNV